MNIFKSVDTSCQISFQKGSTNLLVHLQRSLAFIFKGFSYMRKIGYYFKIALLRLIVKYVH